MNIDTNGMAVGALRMYIFHYHFKCKIMKLLSICAILLFATFNTAPAIAQSGKQTANIKVWGNCGMCKKTIEKSAKSAGAKTASWNDESKMLTVSFVANKTSTDKIQDAIAAAGYDTQDRVATEEAYQGLPGCCQYERKGTETDTAKKCCGDETCGKESDTCKEKGCCKDTTCCKKS